MQNSIDQLAIEPPEFVARAKTFLADLRSHYWLDGGRLAVAHAGLKEEMIGRGSPAVRDFALFGETTGETDEFGLPVRLDWAANYRGKTTIVYGHTPTPEAEWVNNTICIDTGCVFGGKLTALRWPERELVSVPAAAGLCPSPCARSPRPRTFKPHRRKPTNLLDAADVLGRRWIDDEPDRAASRSPEENAAAALEAMSRFAIAPQWLVYLPPTMSPVETSAREGWLERPEEAFAFYRERGQREVVLRGEAHGLARMPRCSAATLTWRGGGSGSPRARAARSGPGPVEPFSLSAVETEALLARLRAACDMAGLWEELETDWLLFDAEIMPWSAKASALIEQQYAPVAAAGTRGTGSGAFGGGARGVARRASRGPSRTSGGRAWSGSGPTRKAWRPYVWPVQALDDLKLAPFHLLASEGATHFDRDHRLAHGDRRAARDDRRRQCRGDALADAGARRRSGLRRGSVVVGDADGLRAARAWSSSRASSSLAAPRG